MVVVSIGRAAGSLVWGARFMFWGVAESRVSAKKCYYRIARSRLVVHKFLFLKLGDIRQRLVVNPCAGARSLHHRFAGCGSDRTLRDDHSAAVVLFVGF